jgi:LmbE family N-acetylglucosaminyl deacetylase
VECQSYHTNCVTPGDIEVEATMTDLLKLLCVLAHPDDESLGTGSILARYGAEGVQTTLITATRGERGWPGDEAHNPGLASLGCLREGELRAAAQVLGLHEVSFLDYCDGDLDQVDASEAIGQIASQVRRIQPDVVVTFDPYGSYGHPDHIAISQFTTAALVTAASPDFDDPNGRPPYQVAKLYYMVETTTTAALYEKVFGQLVKSIDGRKRGTVAWPEWAITTRIDARSQWQRVWQAILCHRSQLPQDETWPGLTPYEHELLWGQPAFYRVYSLVNGGRQLEDDLFAGLR